MTIFDANDLAMMRETQEAHMQDVCLIRVFSAGTANEFGEFDAPSYDESQAVKCGLDMRAGDERHGQDVTGVMYDATLRLPITVSVKETDQVKITMRFGESLDTPLTYKIVSPIQRGPSGIRLRLEKVVL